MPGNNYVMEFIAIPGMPLINNGDDIAEVIIQTCNQYQIKPIENDVFVIAQKIVSKSEGRYISLESVTPGIKAFFYASITGKDPRLVQLILEESARVVRARKGTLIVKHKLGFVCANAGLDHSNVPPSDGKTENYYLLLPVNPDESARKIQKTLESYYGKKFGVLIIDSHGRAWRYGTIGMSIGLAGVPGLVDLRGREDLFGYKLRITTIGASDELAAGASLLMGQANEGRPCVIARGFPYELRDSSINELIRSKKKDLFR
jgi:coenzyme F420-0:L-glutamate ligase/coenzyme F420-1:gamma-L-glutamate ligase